MKLNLRKTILFLGLAFFVFFSSQSTAANYDVYVNSDNNTGIEDGTQAYPFNTIQEGIDVAANNPKDQRNVFVNNGEYEESIVISSGVKLFGESQKRTIIRAIEKNWAVEMKKGSKIKKFRVYVKNKGIIISKEGDVDISKCTIKDADKIGIYIKKGSTKKSKEINIKNNKISGGDGKGMYIKRSRVNIKDNEVYDLDEEGIDLRAGVKGKIKGNDIYNNGETGLEFEIRKLDLKISKNKIKNNAASGVGAQFRKTNIYGDILLKGNKIYKNANYGVKCANTVGGHPNKNYFTKSLTLENNIFFKNSEGNGKGAFISRCGFSL